MQRRRVLQVKFGRIGRELVCRAAEVLGEGLLDEFGRFGGGVTDGIHFPDGRDEWADAVQHGREASRVWLDARVRRVILASSHATHRVRGVCASEVQYCTGFGKQRTPCYVGWSDLQRRRSLDWEPA
jgi:hypothetical protein